MDSLAFPDPSATAVMLVDLQNDFIHPEGAYARGGAKSGAIAACRISSPPWSRR